MWTSEQEVTKRNQALLYVLKDDALKKEGEDENLVEPAAVAGYLMYSWTSLAASVTKLAGASIIIALLMFHSCVNRNYLIFYEESLVIKVLAVEFALDLIFGASFLLSSILAGVLETLLFVYYRMSFGKQCPALTTRSSCFLR